MSATTPCQNLGFLSIVQDHGGYVGGYLVTNAWGRPLEFRLSSAVVPNKVQQILYGPTLGGYLCGDVIGKTLIEKTATNVRCILVDNPLALDLRLRIEMPVGLWHPLVDPEQAPPGFEVMPRLYCHEERTSDADVLRDAIAKMGSLDVSEPFTRVREAMSEARKLGVTSRVAA